jgi:hypothetical protein
MIEKEAKRKQETPVPRLRKYTTLSISTATVATQPSRRGGFAWRDRKNACWSERRKRKEEKSAGRRKRGVWRIATNPNPRYTKGKSTHLCGVCQELAVCLEKGVGGGPLEVLVQGSDGWREPGDQMRVQCPRAMVCRVPSAMAVKHGVVPHRCRQRADLPRQWLGKKAEAEVKEGKEATCSVSCRAWVSCISSRSPRRAATKDVTCGTSSGGATRFGAGSTSAICGSMCGGKTKTDLTAYNNSFR